MAVGDRQCVCTGRGAWLSFVVCLLFRGQCGHLWAFVFVGIVVCDHCGRSLLFTVWAVCQSLCVLMVVVRRRATTSCCQTNIVCYP